MISGRKDSFQSEQDSRKADGLRLTGVWTSFDDIPTSCMSENSRRALEEEAKLAGVEQLVSVQQRHQAS